jgi:hypothetical protein
MIARMILKKLFHAGVIALLVLCALANFYRNRDPYRAYFHQRADHYLTTHFIDSTFSTDGSLERRLAGMASLAFYAGIHDLYKGKTLILPDDCLFDCAHLRIATGKDVIVQASRAHLSSVELASLLRQGRYSFFYDRHFFNSSADKSTKPCNHNSDASRQENARLDGKHAPPVLMVLLPAVPFNDPFVQVLLIDKYLLFVPSQHPILDQNS